MMLKGETVELVEITSRVDMQNNVTKHEKLPRDEDLPGVDAVSDDQASHRSFGNPTTELSMRAPVLVSEPADLR